jgi:hypothetical protein
MSWQKKGSIKWLYLNSLIFVSLFGLAAFLQILVPFEIFSEVKNEIDGSSFDFDCSAALCGGDEY